MISARVASDSAGHASITACRSGPDRELPMTNGVLGSWLEYLDMPRIIYSLKFDLGQTANGEIIQLIAPLDPSGQSPYCKAMPPKKRVIDLRVGDYIWHR